MDGIDRYVCTCSHKYTGKNCETSIGEFTRNWSNIELICIIDHNMDASWPAFYFEGLLKKQTYRSSPLTSRSTTGLNQLIFDVHETSVNLHFVYFQCFPKACGKVNVLPG